MEEQFLMVLLRAFDTLNHDLLFAELYVYEFDELSLKILHSYLWKRWYRTKVTKKFNSWAELLKSVPEESVLGPLLSNIYLNDLFFFLNIL